MSRRATLVLVLHSGEPFSTVWTGAPPRWREHSQHSSPRHLSDLGAVHHDRGASECVWNPDSVWMGVVLLVAATPIAKRVRCATQLSVSDLAVLGEPAKWTGVVRHSCLRCSAHQFVGASFRACVHVF